MLENRRFGTRTLVLCLVCFGLFLYSSPAIAAPTTLTWSPGWDYFDQQLDYGSSNVSYSILSPTSLEIMYHLVGAVPSSSHDVGIHEFLSTSVGCNLVTFGQFPANPDCGSVTRQGVTAFVTAFEFGTLNVDASGNGDFDVVVTGLTPGLYNLEFTVRKGPICPGSDCGVIYQSPGPIFGDSVAINTVPEPGAVILFASAALGAVGAVRRKLKL